MIFQPKMAGLVLALLLVSGPAQADDLALVGGDVYTVSGAMLPGATVVIRGEKITAVGRDVAVPANATVIDCKGKMVMPGFIESQSAIGLVEIDLERSTVDSAPNLKDPVRAAVMAQDAVDLRSTVVGVVRRHGVTSAVSAPEGGLISGRSAWLDLVGPRSAMLPQAVSGPIAMHVWLGETGASAVGSSRATAIAKLREVLDDARTYRRSKTAFTRGDLYELSASRLDLEALGDVITGRMPVVIAASRASDILAVLELAKTEKLEVAILGAEEGWLVADALAAAKVPVIVDPAVNLPMHFEQRNARGDNAALLARAGVRVAIATRTTHNAGNLRFLLGNAVRAGMPRELALRAGTLTPAEVYGMEKTYGSIDVNKVANVVVWTGDPFEPASFAETIIVRGEVQPVENRQTRLAERYIERLKLRK